MEANAIINAFTVDVEDYFHVSAYAGVVDREQWAKLPSRVARNTETLTSLLDEAGVRGTFFVLGWVAEHYPDVVRQISAAGHEVAWAQLPLPWRGPAVPAPDLESLPDLRVEATAGRYVFTADGFRAVIENGSLTSLVYGDREMLHEGAGPRLNVNRALVDNDVWFRRAFEQSGLSAPERQLTLVTQEPVAGAAGKVARLRIVTPWEGNRDSLLLHDATYTILGSGAIVIDSLVLPRGELPPLPKLGSRAPFASNRTAAKSVFPPTVTDPTRTTRPSAWMATPLAKESPPKKLRFTVALPSSEKVVSGEPSGSSRSAANT